MVRCSAVDGAVSWIVMLVGSMEELYVISVGKKLCVMFVVKRICGELAMIVDLTLM